MWKITRRSRVSRRDFLKTIGSAAAGLTISSCLPRSVEPDMLRTSGVNLVYQDWRTNWFPEIAQELLRIFQELHPNINVYYLPEPEPFEEQMLTDLQAGTAADVFAGSCPLFPVWEQMGYLLDLSPYVFADLDPSTLKDWDKTQYQAFSNGEGHQFALPKFSGALVLFFNKDLFDQLRLDYPDNTWNRADYLAAMHAITQDNDLDGKVDQWGSMMDISWDRIQVHVNGWGGNLVDPSNPSRSLMASQESLDAMGWIRDLIWRDHFMPSSLDVQRMKPVSAFIQQRVGMIEEGSWVLKDILENASFRVGVTTFPSGPVKKVTLTSTHGYAVYAGTKYPDAAWELVKFLTSHEYGRALARGHLLQPARLSLFNEWADNIRNEYPKQFKELDINAFNDGRIQGYSTTSEVFANMSEALRLSNIAWEQIFTLGQLSVNVMKDVSAQIEKSQ